MSLLFINRFFSDGNPEAEKELINWWFEEHSPAMQNISGVKKSFLYKVVGERDAPTFQVVMLIEDRKTIETEEWRQNVHASEWLNKLSLHFASMPGVYEQIFPPEEAEDKDFLEGEYIYLTLMTPIPQMEEAFNDFYNNEHLGHICDVPGVRNGRRYRRVDSAFPNAPKYVAFYEVDDPHADDRPEWAAARAHSAQRGVMRKAKYLKGFRGAYQKVLTKPVNS